MIFKKINLEYYSFTEEDREDIEMLLKKGLRKSKDKLLSLRQLDGASSGASSDDGGGSLLDPDNFLNRERGDRPGADVSEANSESRGSTGELAEDLASNLRTAKSRQSKVKRRGPRRREQHLIVMDLFLALILCHNVTPVYTY